MSHVTRVKHSTGRMTTKKKKDVPLEWIKVVSLVSSETCYSVCSHFWWAISSTWAAWAHAAFFRAAFSPGFGGGEVKIHLHTSHSWVAWIFFWKSLTVEGPTNRCHCIFFTGCMPPSIKWLGIWVCHRPWMWHDPWMRVTWLIHTCVTWAPTARTAPEWVMSHLRMK